MTVLLITEQIEPGGKRSHVEALFSGLEAIGWHPRLFDRRSLSFSDRALISIPIRTLDFLGRGLGHLWLIPELERAMKRRLRAMRRSLTDVSVLHVQEPTSFSAARASGMGKPVALTVHGPIHREVASGYGLELSHPVIRRLYEIERRAYLEADAVIAVDRAHAEYVRSFGREDVWSIPNFVDTRRFHPDVVPHPLPAQTEAWIAGRQILLCTRRLVPKNGVDIALRAVGILAEQRIPCVLIIVGDGPQRASLEGLAREMDLARVVRFVGSAPPPAIPGWCRRASAVLVPSVPSMGVEEATSISVLEAQACARPVVASSLGGILEIVEDGVSGLLVPPGDPEALAGAVQRVLIDSELGRRLGACAAARVAEEHSHVAGARRYAAVYRHLNFTPSAPPH